MWKLYRELVPKIDERTVESIYKALDRLLDEVHRDITIDELEAFYGSLNVNNSKEEKEVIYAIFSDLRTKEIEEDVVNSCLRTIQQRSAASKLAVECINVVEGRRSFDDLRKAWDQQAEQLQATEASNSDDVDPFVDIDLDSIYSSNVKSQGLRWRLNCLNKSLGSLRKGDFGFLFARPETGKSTFLASEVSYMASQANAPILIFLNEEQGAKVVLRYYQAVLGINTQELMRDRKGNTEKFLELTKGNLRFFDSASIHKKQVEQLCEKYKPALIVGDQVDKFKGFSDDREDLRLGAIYIWTREIAKTYCPVIGVCQAAGTAEGKKWLTMDDVANAKTAKQAEADWILGIGKTHEVGYEYMRYINICKNKLVGDEDTLPELRHGKLEVVIEPSIGRYRDL